jgi:hypothetical protein
VLTLLWYKCMEIGRVRVIEHVRHGVSLFEDGIGV